MPRVLPSPYIATRAVPIGQSFTLVSARASCVMSPLAELIARSLTAPDVTHGIVPPDQYRASDRLGVAPLPTRASSPILRVGQSVEKRPGRTTDGSVAPLALAVVMSCSTASRREKCSSMATTIRSLLSERRNGDSMRTKLVSCDVASKVLPAASLARSSADLRIAQSKYSVLMSPSGLSAARPLPIAQSTGATFVGPTGALTDTSTEPVDACFFGFVVHFLMLGKRSPNSVFP